MSSIARIDKSICTGCGLCAAVCPKGAIAMQADEEGFLQPVLRKEECVDCGLCLQGCPAEVQGLELERSSYFCCVAVDPQLLLRGSSGGVFGILAGHFLAHGGWVCGCVYDDTMKPIHILSDSWENVQRMYGSKYVQSECYGVFPQIREKLELGAKVLFTGTACQAAALRGYLKKDYANLYIAEILCHGVPSPGLLEKYVVYLEKKLGGKVLDVQFRNKERDGWGSEHRTCVVYRDRKGVVRKYRPVLPAYFSAFFYGANLRQSCYNCRFAKPERVADLTLGDYWGSWRKYGKRFHEGISVVSVNSLKGQSMADVVREASTFFEVLTREEAFWSNDNFTHPVKCPVEREAFYKNQPNYRGLWKKAYLTRTYRKKTLQSFYGALVPAKIRFMIHKIRKK